jgi:hypothetical protein
MAEALSSKYTPKVISCVTDHLQGQKDEIFYLYFFLSIDESPGPLIYILNFIQIRFKIRQYITIRSLTGRCYYSGKSSMFSHMQ